MTRPKCVGALLARNEAGPDRYLERVLKNAFQFCDEVVVLDDHSTDATAGVCRDAGAIVHERTEGDDGGWWGGDGSESPARAALWRLAATAAGPNGWVLTFDADMELLGLRPADFKRLLTASTVNSWAWVLYDLWDSPDTHRVDSFWVGWRTPRVWLARAQPAPDFVPEWGDRAIHCGHLPANYPVHAGLAPNGTAWGHLGYIVAQQRVDKQRKYLYHSH